MMFTCTKKTLGRPKISNMRNLYGNWQIHIYSEREMLKNVKIIEIRPRLGVPIERQSFST